MRPTTQQLIKIHAYEITWVFQEYTHIVKGYKINILEWWPFQDGGGIDNVIRNRDTRGFISV